MHFLYNNLKNQVCAITNGKPSPSIIDTKIKYYLVKLLLYECKCLFWHSQCANHQLTHGTPLIAGHGLHTDVFAI